MATPGERFGEGRLTGFFFFVVVRFMYCFSCEVHIVVMLTELCKFGVVYCTQRNYWFCYVGQWW